MPANIHDEYRFFYNHPVMGEKQCYPANDQLEWTWEQEDDQLFFRKKLDTTLNFINDDRRQIDDFDQLYGIDRSENRCSTIFFRIEKKCGEAWTEFWKGEMLTVDGEWNPDRCRVSIKPRVRDNWTCIEKRLKVDVNLFDRISDRKALDWWVSKVEKKTCSTSYQLSFPVGTPPLNDECLDTSLGSADFDWSPLKHIVAYADDNEFYFLVETTWIREIYEDGNQFGPPPGNGWTDRGNGVYTREMPTRLDSFDIVNPYKFLHNDHHISTYEPIFPLVGEIANNGLKLTEVIEAMLEDCEANVISDFYGLNADNTAPDNHAYQKASEECQELYVYQITDIKKVSASEYATILPLTLEQLFENLKAIHNVYPGFDENGIFRIEHVSYWKREFMLDLTQSEFIVGHNQYTYEKNDLPKKEVWSWLDSTTDEDFKGLPILYESCMTDDNPDEVRHNADYCVTDIVNLRRNLDAASNDGMVLIEFDDTGVVMRTECLITGEVKINGSLSLGNLLYNYHRWRRPQLQGNMNGEDEVFFSQLPVRKQEGLKVKICCDDLTTFNPIDYVKSQLGWGEVEQATYKAPHDLLTISLRHNA